MTPRLLIRVPKVTESLGKGPWWTQAVSKELQRKPQTEMGMTLSNIVPGGSRHSTILLNWHSDSSSNTVLWLLLRGINRLRTCLFLFRGQGGTWDTNEDLEVAEKIPEVAVQVNVASAKSAVTPPPITDPTLRPFDPSGTPQLDAPAGPPIPLRFDRVQFPRCKSFVRILTRSFSRNGR